MAQYNDDQKQNLNFTDSWLQNTVELAALGAIVSGAGALAVKGDLGGAVRTSKRALGAAGKGLENYIRRKTGMGTRLGYNIGKKTFRNLRRVPRTTEESDAAALAEFFTKNIQEVDYDPEVQRKIRQEAARRLGNQTNRNIMEEALDGTVRSKEELKDQARFLYEKVRDEEIKSRINHTPSPLDPFPRKRESGQQTNKKPLDKKQLARDLVGSGLTGLAFGGGISAMHALDRASADLDNQRKLENAFNYAGSFLSKEDDKKMDKKAGSLDAYNALKGFGKKTPEAIMGGLGFTGVSLGTAKLMNQNKSNSTSDEDEKNKNTRVIIELGNPDENNKNIQTQPMGLAGLPRVASSPSAGIEKEARPSFNRLRQFANDFKGHGKEIEQLQQLNPADIAASRLKNEDIPSLLKNQYGNLVNDASETQFRKTLFDSRTEQAKQEINDQIKQLETQKASARLKGVGGLLGAGGGLAGLSAMKSQKEEGA